MAKICPVCQGNLVGCPTCNSPPMRVLPTYSGVKSLRSIIYGAKVWEVQGIDISKWNGQLNFGITKTKAQYAIMRLGYGTEWKDPKADTFYRDAMANDFPVGVYWFCNIGQDYVKHATNFASEIATHRPQLDIVLDAESTTLNPDGTLNWLIECDKKLTSLTGKQAIIYTSKGFWDAKVARSSYFSGRLNWVANWTTRDYPSMPIDFTQYGHWQWSADGNMKAAEYGSTGGDPDMDLNRFNGTVAQFNSKYGTHIQPIGVVPPVVPTLPPYVIINTAELAIHSTPQAVQTNIIGHALQNTKWYPLEEVVSGISWYRLANGAYISKGYTKYP